MSRKSGPKKNTVSKRACLQGPELVHALGGVGDFFDTR